MEGRWVIWILVASVLRYERMEGGGSSSRDEVHFIEETCTQSLYPCSITTVGIVKITCRGPFQGDCKGSGGVGHL
jgi:hypothetical protein